MASSGISALFRSKNMRRKTDGGLIQPITAGSVQKRGLAGSRPGCNTDFLNGFIRRHSLSRGNRRTALRPEGLADHIA